MLTELRLRSSLESSWVELGSLGEAVDGCALESMLVAAVVVVVASGITLVTTSGFTSVATWLGRYLLSGISMTDSVSLSGASANAANGLGVPIAKIFENKEPGQEFTGVTSNPGLISQSRLISQARDRDPTSIIHEHHLSGQHVPHQSKQMVSAISHRVPSIHHTTLSQ